MSRKIILASAQIDMSYLLPTFAKLAPELDIHLHAESGAPEDADTVLCWHAPAGLFGTLPRLRLVQSIAAGVDHILADPSLPPDVPICRVIDPDMASGMVAYVVWAVAYRHRNFDQYLARSAQGLWQESPIVPTRLHRVGIAGLGVLGTAVAKALKTIGYDVAGWSRSPKPDLPDGIQGFHGADQLGEFLARTDSLVCLLPLTDDTKGFLNARLFARLPAGAHLINVGRGAHLIEEDLLAALDRGQLGAATLDAFTQEPLPEGHPFWRDPRIIVTPHIATRTGPTVVVTQLLANLARQDAGTPLFGAIDRQRGY